MLNPNTIPALPANGEKSAYYKYNPPVNGEIAIIASTPYIGYDVPPIEILNELHDCGFNIINITPSQSDIKPTLDLLEKANLKAILFHSHLYNQSSDISQEEVDRRCTTFVKAFMNHPALAGWSLPDQPTYTQLSDKSNRSFYHFYNLIKDTDPNHLIFVNLVGSNVKKFMEEHYYADYMNIFQKNFTPGLWSYDLYPVCISKGKIQVDRDLFYSDFELYSLRSKVLNRPFWAYCQSMGFKNSTIERPNPKEEYLRYEAFSALGYGAQGITYWTYHQRPDNDIDIYYSAPIDLSNKKTDIWGYVQNVNKEIKCLNPIFFGTQLMMCKHTVNRYLNCELLNNGESFGPLIDIVSGGIGFQISHLNTKGQDYIVLVNHDIEKSQDVSLNFSDFWEILELKPNSSYEISQTKINGNINRSVKPGGYLIFKWS